MKHVYLLILGLAPVLLSAQALPTTMQEATLGTLVRTEDRIVQLANAIPADKYNWRPDDGVRSVAEAILHVAGANYFFLMSIGVNPPEGVDIMTLEKSTTDKEAVIQALKASYAFSKEKIGTIPDDQLLNKVEFPFPGEYNTMSALMIWAGHCEEHMGQLIAYARSNGVAPPWSN